MKEKRGSFWKKLNHPAQWIAVLIYFLTLTLCPLAILSIVFGHGDSIYATIGYVICGILLLYSLISVGLAIYRKIAKVADRYAFTRHFYRSYAFRSLVLTGCSFVFNIGFTLFLCVIALRLDSAWYGALAVYYILLTITRGGMLIQTSVDEYKFKDNPTALHKAKVGTYLYTGIMILFLTAAFAVSVVEVTLEGSGVRVPAWAIYAFAAFTAARLFMGVWHFVKSSNFKDLTTRSAQYINMTTALVSLLPLQTALLSLIKTDLVPAMINGATGGLVCLAELSLGIYMIVHSGVKYKRIKRKEKLLQMQAQADSGYNRADYADEYQGEQA